MKPLYLFLAILILVVLVLFWKRTRTEGFGIFRDMTTEFTNDQRSFFHDILPKAIFVNKDIQLNKTSVNNSLRQGDMYLPNSPDRDFSVYLQEENNKFTETDYNLCRGAREPKQLNRAPKATIGCGWWFVEDPTKPSIGALGYRRGPVDSTLAQTYPGGRWIWSLQEAQQLEATKRCKQVTTCEAMNAEGIRENCGFCNELGYAIPIDSNGNALYPDDPAASCPSTVIRSADNCPTTLDLLNGSGASTKEEEGTVLDPQTGAPVSIPQNMSLVRGVCDPDPNGQLTTECLISLAKSVGLGEAGVILRKLRGQTYDLGLYKAAKELVQPAGIFIVETNMDRDTAVNLYARISAAQNNPAFKIREAAKYLASGNPNFDVCTYEDKDVGPFATDCLQREFRKAGCQLAGKAAPNDITASKYTDWTWDRVKSEFANLFQRTRSKDTKIQERAVLECIGTQLYHAKPDICEEPGIEYKVFTQEGLYVGRVVSKEGLLSDAGLRTPLQIAGPSAQVFMETNLTVRSSASIQIEGILPVRNGVKMYAGEKEQPQLLSPAKTSAVTNPNLMQVQFLIPIQPKKRNVLATEYIMNTTPSLLTNSEFIQSNLPLFQLSRDSWKPVYGFDYFGPYVEYAATTENRFHPGNLLGSVGTPSRKALQLNNTTFGAGSLHTSAVQSICWMECLQQRGVYPDVFTLKGSNPKFHLGVAHMKDEDGIQIGLYTDKGQIYESMKGSDFAPGKWVHYALVLHADRQGFHFYVNGVKKNTSRGVLFENTFVQLTFGSSQFQGGIAWFHIYDYPLTPQEVMRDKMYETPNYEMETPAVPNIRVRDYLVREYEREDYAGGDYDSLTFMDQNNTKNRVACQDACGTQNRCIAYTFNPYTGKCWLKERIYSRNQNLPEGIQAGRILKDISVESDTDGNSRCLDVQGFNGNDGTPVKTWNCNGLDNQRFALDDLDRLRAKHSGKCLEVENGRMDDSALLVQRECSDVEHQKWIMDREGRLHPKHNPVMCLDSQGDSVQQRPCTSAPNQRWIVRDAEKTANKVIFYEHCNYMGSKYEMGIGYYFSGKDFPKNQLSSVRVPPGRTAIVYKQGQGGPVAFFTSDSACFLGQQFNDGTDINDQISTIVIE